MPLPQATANSLPQSLSCPILAPGQPQLFAPSKVPAFSIQNNGRASLSSFRDEPFYPWEAYLGYLPHDVSSWLRANQATVTRLSAPWNALHKSYDVTSKLVKPISLIQVKAGIDMFILRAAASTRRFPDAGLWTNNNRPMKPIIQDSNQLAIHPRDWLPSVVAPLTLSQRRAFVQASLIRNRRINPSSAFVPRSTPSLVRQAQLHPPSRVTRPPLWGSLMSPSVLQIPQVVPSPSGGPSLPALPSSTGIT